MHLKLKSYLKCVTQCIQASLDVFRQKKIIRKIPLFSRESSYRSWTSYWGFILVWWPGAYCAEYMFANFMYSFFVSQRLLFFQNGPYFYSERFRKRNLLIKLVRIQSTWWRLGSLINVMLLFWQKCKQAYEVSAMQSQTVNSYIFEPTMITIMRNGLKRL